jgi:tetratricopeptide (TPR) repeat protein
MLKLVVVSVCQCKKVYRETGDSVWLDRAKSCKREMKLWTSESSLSSYNFAHKLLLLEAEEQYSAKNFSEAMQLYTNAINTARNTTFLNEEALAYQLAAQFCLAIGSMQSSLEYFRLAHEKYQTWGACAKARQLLEFVNETFGQGSF